VTRCDKGRVQVTTPCSNTKQVNTRHAQTPTIKQVNTRHAQTPTIKQVNTRHSPTPTKGHHPRRPAEAKLPLVQEYHSFSRVTPCTSCLRSSAVQRSRGAVLSNGQGKQCCPTAKRSSAVQRSRGAVLSNGQGKQCCPTAKRSSAVQWSRGAVLSNGQGKQCCPKAKRSSAVECPRMAGCPHSYNQSRLRPATATTRAASAHSHSAAHSWHLVLDSTAGERKRRRRRHVWWLLLANEKEATRAHKARVNMNTCTRH
jgi:hypothetical protein